MVGCVCVRACVRACVRVCVPACVCGGSDHWLLFSSFCCSIFSSNDFNLALPSTGEENKPGLHKYKLTAIIT